MRWVYSLCLVTLVSAAGAEDRGPWSSEQTLLQKQQCRFEVILGRVILRSGSPAKGQHRQSNNGSEESLTVSSQPGGPSLHYIRHTDRDALLLDVYDGDQMRLQWRQRNKGAGAPELVVVQPATGPIQVDLAQQEHVQRLSAPSFWHLCVEHRAAFEAYLRPLLLELGITPHGGWNLGELDQQLRSALDAGGAAVDHQEFRRLVSQLGHPSRALRNAAQRRLQQQGLSVLPLIAALPGEDLSAEQQARLAQVRRNLTPVDGDRAARLAEWLGSDLTYWSSLVKDWKPSDRIAADRYLRERVGRGLPSDVLESSLRIADGSAGPIQR